MSAEEIIQGCLDDGASASDIVSKLEAAGLVTPSEEKSSDEGVDVPDEGAGNGAPSEGEPDDGESDMPEGEDDEDEDKPPAPHSDASYRLAIQAALAEAKNRKSPMDPL